MKRIRHFGERKAHCFCAWVVLVAAGMWSTGVPPALAAEGKRVAFVVGIGTYDNLPADKQLRNAVNDAEGVSAKLGEIGFEVRRAPNLKRSAFNETWQTVLDSLTKDDTFVLFFSGHGVQIEGENYLLPRDIPFIEYGKQEQLKRESISVNQLLDNLTMGTRPHPKRAVVILDACRDNPLIPPGYKSIKTPSGLAKPSSTEGLFVIYSAVENSVSLDRLPDDPASLKYSVFTRALLPLLDQHVTLQDLSVKLKKDVSTLAKNAGRRQLPSYYDGTDGEPFCLPGCLTEADKSTVRFKENLTGTVQNTITGKDGAPMVLIPAGSFQMGSTKVEVERQIEDCRNALKEAFDGKLKSICNMFNSELPRHQVSLGGFYMDKFEVTVASYAEFVRTTSRAKPENWDWVDSSKHRNLPIVGVEWHDATAYCEWAGKRLPTDAEWEKAARGTDGRTYPWGNDQPTAKLANFGKEFTTNVYNVYDEHLAPVDSYEAGNSPYGLHHMAGNASEWTADWYDENYYGKSPERNPTGPSIGGSRGVRGGSWGDAPKRMRSATRHGFIPSERSVYIGFRCAQDAK